MSMSLEFSKIQPYIREAGQVALNFFQTGLTREYKADDSPVTKADQAVERFLTAKIEHLYSEFDYEIIGEEFGGNNQGKEYSWAIDPIDGTRVFLDGLPTWCISVGLLRNSKPYRGAVYLPVIGEMYYTDDDGHAFWNGEPLTNMMASEWNRDSFIAVPSGTHRYFEVDFPRVRSFGAIATHHVYVARGAAVATLHRRAALWDLAGAHAILTAVGGVATYLDGSPVLLKDILIAGDAKAPMLAGHPKLVEQLLPKIKLRS